MKIASLVILIIFLSLGCATNTDADPPNKKSDFCGASTGGPCQNDGDCMTGGCSSQVCQSKNEEPVITTCEWQDCYQASNFGVQCVCLEGKCLWD